MFGFEFQRSGVPAASPCHPKDINETLPDMELGSLEKERTAGRGKSLEGPRFAYSK
jgi:hypothetical protein